jgi:peptidoglycan/LPS O-acetylase OafA/YrhL
LGWMGLRGLAAVGVLLGHLGGLLAVGVEQPFPLNEILALSGTGLTLFFTLSGFLLYRSFAAAIIAGSECRIFDDTSAIERYEFSRHIS